MKKILVCLLVMLLVIGCVACAANDTKEENGKEPTQSQTPADSKVETADKEETTQTPAEEETEEREPLTIGIINSDSLVEYWAICTQGVYDHVREGDTVIELDISSSVEKLQTCIDDLISRDVDAVITTCFDAGSATPMLQRLNDAGIPVFCYDIGPLEEDRDLIKGQVTIGTYAGAYACGYAMGENISEGGGVLSYCFIFDDSSNERYQGMVDGLKDANPTAYVIENSTNAIDAETVVSTFEDMLLAHPEAEGIYCSTESVLLGACQVVASIDRDDIYVTSFDATRLMVEQMNAGHADFLTEIGPYTVGTTAINMVYEYFDTGAVANDNVVLDVVGITPENCNDPEIAVSAWLEY